MTSLVPRSDLRAFGERDLAEQILGEPAVRSAIDQYEKRAGEAGARRQLLATALRLTQEMVPDVHEIVQGCRLLLGLHTPIETYVYPDIHYNAAAVRPERGRLFIIFSAGLLEGFEPDELRFVVGHEQTGGARASR